MKIDIVGKNKSIWTFPKSFFVTRESVGINHAAILYKTNWAFSPYPFMINEFMKTYRIEQLISVKMLEVFKDYHKNYTGDQWPNEVPGLDHYIGYNNFKHPKMSEVEKYVLEALAANFDYPYTTKHTSLHLIMMWCICKGYNEIGLFGCNNDTNSLYSVREDIGNDPEIAAQRLEFTTQIMNDGIKHGIQFKLWKDYNEYQEETK